MTLSHSPDRNTFSAQSYREKLLEDPNDEEAQSMIEIIEAGAENSRKREQQPDWSKNNLEYDLRSTEWMLEKVRTQDVYAQNLYAAICNNSFQRLDVWPILKGETWSCSWRYAGGIVADMLEKGDYIDWYCSGIKCDWSDEEYANATKEDQERYLYMKNHYVPESVVTDEIREDLFKLGWLVVVDKDVEID